MVVSPAPPPLASQESVYRRRLAWMAFTLHTLFSFEYGRSNVHLPFNTQDPAETTSSTIFPHDLLSLAKLVPSDYELSKVTPEAKIASLRAALTNMMRVRPVTDARLLVKTDLVLSVYRRFRLLRITLSADELQSFIDLGRAALTAVQTLLTQSRPWWNLVSTTFQLICAFLSFGRLEALVVVPEALGVLEQVNERWNTHISREAISTAKSLIDMVKQREEASLEALRGVSTTTYNTSDTMGSEGTPLSKTGTSPDGNPEELTFLEWPDFSFNWDPMLADYNIIHSDNTLSG